MSQEHQQEQQQTTIPKWHLKADYVETCNCDYGCPCNFNGFPTYGSCRALVLFSIREGNYGDTRIDGIDVIEAESWPKAIHEGNGTLQLYISKHATEDQRNAVINIFTGKAKGDGQFALFAPTYKYILEPQYVDIKKTIIGKKSSFSVPGIIEVQLESFRNPVTGEEQETKIQLPKGFIFKMADAAKSKLMRILTSNMNFDHSGQNAFFAQVEYRGP
ncbi:MAG: DUF1326 domain-containing protein [Thermoproteota archaeon]|nr:DUF1326 domain-containing protein [Thermoproteota archaeon]